MSRTRRAWNKGMKNPIRRRLNFEDNPMKRPEVVEKMRQAQLRLIREGKTNPTKNLGNYARKGEYSGEKSPSYGIKRSEEYKRKSSLSRIGKKNPKLFEKRKKLFREGKLKSHNEGKTKENYNPLKMASESQLGEKNHHWKGGKSFEPYGIDFSKELRRLVRKRDNQICMVCGIHREKLNRALSVHHINYDKLCNIPQNLISLCASCHTKTSFNRSHWKAFFQSMLLERYSYQYNEIGEVILGVNNGSKN